jgi:chemotaxis methyl-accepting protein methylase/chemotaxis response regulator CheB/signal transduction histidine kinase
MRPRIVAIGASAGGLHALSRFFGAANRVPDELAFVVVVHLAPGAESHLPELLAKETALAVSVIENGDILRAGHVYVIPPKVSVTIVQGAFRVRPAVERPAIPMPIDECFISLAADQGEHAIGIILTGANADGSAGLQAIKAEGGMVMAQAPDTAEHSSMPRHAIATGLVDYVLPIEDMPAVLFDYIERSTAGASENSADSLHPIDLEPVLSALAAAGSDFRGYKRGTLERRIARRMAVTKVDTFGAYSELLRDKIEEAQALSLDMMIGVTEFFRDPDAWDVLSERVLSKLLEEPEGEQPLRVWIPGCATGEEAYSIAMLITEEIEKRRVNRAFTILASDVNRFGLARARLGIYSPSIAVAVGEERLNRFFNIHSDGYQVRQELREKVLFTPQNLIADPPFSRVDLISCRNLLIYLEPDAQHRVFELFHFALNPKRYLFLGRSESIDPDTVQFQEISRAWRIYQRSPVVAPTVSGYRFSAKSAGREEFPPASRIGMRSKGYADLVNATLLEEHHAASVLINTAHQVLYVSGSADEYLRQPAGEPTGNILDMAREGLRLKLRIVLRRATQSHAVTLLSEVISDGGASAIKITVARPVDVTHAGKVLLVVFARVPTADRPLSSASSGVDSDLWHLESELRTTQVELGSTIEELEESNTELRVSNEEILSINEELRSANEELETSKEELQTVNEQLNVANVQLEQKVRQLEVLNEDIANLLASTEVATLLLNADHVIKRFTPNGARILSLSSFDIGRAISDVNGHPLGMDLSADIDCVLRGQVLQVEKEIETPSAEWYVRRVTPYLATLGMPPAGVTVTWTNITFFKLADGRAKHLAALSDRLRAPLAAICYGGELLTDLHAAEQQKAWAADVVQRQGDVMRKLMDDMHDTSGVNSGGIKLHCQVVTLDAIVRSAVEICQPIFDERHHRLSVSLPDVPVMLYADAVRLSQALEQILMNAVTYTKPGGEVTLTGVKIGCSATLRICDNGRIIPAAMLGSLFDHSVQAPLPDSQGPGASPGLSVARRLIELHGGVVTASSDGKTGSEFTVELPLGAPSLDADQDIPETASDEAASMRILIIDDGSDAGAALSLLLQRQGHEVERCEEWARALGVAAVFRPDAILVNLGLRGMDGYEIAKQLRNTEVARHILLVAISTRGTASDRLQSAQAGFDRYLVEPVRTGALMRLLALRKRPAADAEPLVR